MLELFSGILQGAAKESQDQLKRDYLKSQQDLIDIQAKTAKAALAKAEAKEKLIQGLGAAGQPIQTGVGAEGGLGMDVSYGSGLEELGYKDTAGQSLSGTIADYSKGGFGMGAGEQMPTDIQTQDQFLSDQQARTQAGQENRLTDMFKGLSAPEIMVLMDNDLSKAMEFQKSIKEGKLSDTIMGIIGKQLPDPRTENLGGIISKDSKGYPNIAGFGRDDLVFGEGGKVFPQPDVPISGQTDTWNSATALKDLAIGGSLMNPDFNIDAKTHTFTLKGGDPSVAFKPVQYEDGSAVPMPDGSEFVYTTAKNDPSQIVKIQKVKGSHREQQTHKIIPAGERRNLATIDVDGNIGDVNINATYGDIDNKDKQGAITFDINETDKRRIRELGVMANTANKIGDLSEKIYQNQANLSATALQKVFGNLENFVNKFDMTMGADAFNTVFGLQGAEKVTDAQLKKGIVDKRQYESLQKLLATFARGLSNESGALNEGDISRAQQWFATILGSVLPWAGDRPEEASALLNDMQSYIYSNIEQFLPLEARDRLKKPRVYNIRGRGGDANTATF